MSYILGLTGGIATGKSHLSGVLREAGARVIDADQISHEITAENGPAIPLICEAFGPEYAPDGVLDRKKLGALVFSVPEALICLNTITHPLIFEEMNRRIAEAERAGTQVVVLDVPLLYETGLDRLCDEVWCAWIPRRLQLSRLMARDGLTRAAAERRMNSQLSAWEKRRKADRFIDTRGSLEESADKVLAMYRALLKRLDEERDNARK